MESAELGRDRPTYAPLSPRFEQEPVLRDLLNFLTRVGQRKVLAARPEWQQVAIMETAGLAGLTGGAGGQGAVPVRQVEEVTVGRSVDLLVALVVARVIGRVDVTRT